MKKFMETHLLDSPVVFDGNARNRKRFCLHDQAEVTVFSCEFLKPSVSYKLLI